MPERQVLSLGQEDALEKEKATHSHILAWEIPWTQEPGRLQSRPWVTTESDMTQQLNNNNKEVYKTKGLLCGVIGGILYCSLEHRGPPKEMTTHSACLNVTHY